MPWAAAAAIGGAVITSSATRSAAGDQADATRAANDESARQYDNNVALQAPTINTGNAARDRLSYLLGLSPTGYASTTSVGNLGNTSGAGSSSQLTYDQLREQLLSQYTRQSGGATPSTGTNDRMAQFRASDDPYSNPANWRTVSIGNGQGDIDAPTERVYIGPQSTTTIDEAGLDAAIRGRLAEQDAARQAQITAAESDPNYGRLAQEFQFDTYKAPDPYVADKFSYTGEDLYKDPSYLFRLTQGQKALDRQGLASGKFLSGSQLTAAANYGQGAASQEFQSAYQRALGTFGTNEGNRAQAYNTNTANGLNAFNVNQGNRFNAYQANFNNSVNPLLSLAGAATLGSQNLGAAGAASAAQIGANTTAGANASGAAAIAGANSINNGLSNAVTGYQNQQQRNTTNNLLSSLLGGTGGVNNNPSSGLGGLDASTVYGAGSGWGNA